MEKTKVTIELSTSLHQQISGYAKSREISVSAIIRFALLDFVEKHKIAPPAPTKPVELPKPTAQLDEATRQRILDDWN